MFFYNNLILIENSLGNLHLFTLDDGIIMEYYFENKKNRVDKIKRSEDVLIEYDVSIDCEDNIYIIYQDKNYNVILMIIKGEEVKKIILTEEPMPEIYNLDLKIIDGKPHIFYCVLLSDINKEYRIVHHCFNEKKWITYIVQDIRINQVLNPIKTLEYKEELILIYYDYKNTDEIYCNKFKLIDDKWNTQYQLTNNSSPKLYLDSLFIKDKLHLVYCEYQENLVVKYERYEYGNNFIKKEIEEELSNWENISWPTLIYFENKLWIIWAEYENIMSRYSLDNGENWSPIYLWKDSKYKDIFRYKYLTKNKVNNIFNYSFGTIKPDIAFIGFGSLNNTIEIPLKKKMKLSYRKK